MGGSKPPSPPLSAKNQNLAYKKERKITFETKIRVKVCHIQRIAVSIWTIPHVYLDLAPLVRKNQKLA